MRRRRGVAVVVAALLTGGAAAAHAREGDPWLERVRAFEPGPTAGFHADALPRVVRGQPQGLGLGQGSLDVVSLGHGGRIVVSFDDNAVVDGEGDDLVIFENAFVGGSVLFAELAFVEVSADGKNWVMFPFDAASGAGLAGRQPVFANSANGIDPLSPEAGGDRFDLADVGLDYVRFLRITDAGDAIDDPGNHVFPGTKGGFDLDAAGALHSVRLGCIRGTVVRSGSPLASARVVLKAAGEPRRRRRTRADGTFRFCRLRPELDYSLVARDGEGGRGLAGTWIDERQLRVHVDIAIEQEPVPQVLPSANAPPARATGTGLSAGS